MCIPLPDTDVDAWLADLKPYQKNKIQELLQKASPEEAAEAWVSAQGSSATVGFGAKVESKPFFDRLQDELRKFVCGHPDYGDVRKKLGTEAPITHTVLVTLASSSIAVKIGVLTSLIVPGVALLLYAAGKMGVNAWCKGCEWNDSEEDSA